MAVRVHYLILQIDMEQDLQILSGKVSRDHIDVFIFYHPHQRISRIVRWLKDASSRMLLQEGTWR
jgi:putative transposase